MFLDGYLLACVLSTVRTQTLNQCTYCFKFFCECSLEGPLPLNEEQIISEGIGGLFT